MKSSEKLQRGTPAVSLCRAGKLDFGGHIKSWKGKNKLNLFIIYTYIFLNNKGLSEIWWGPEGWVLSVALNSNFFHLGAAFRHKLGQIFNDLQGFRVHWGGDFKQPISTGTQFTLYYCIVLNWPSHTTSLEPIGNKRRKRGGVARGERAGEWGTVWMWGFYFNKNTNKAMTPTSTHTYTNCSHCKHCICVHNSKQTTASIFKNRFWLMLT